METSKNEDIEALRAYAILFTLLLHFDLLLPYASTTYSWMRSYFDFSVGVDLFFVISGYVITQSLIASETKHSVNRGRLIAAFWIKRVFRLLPAAMVWLFVIVIFFHLTSGLSGLMVPIYAAMLNLMNLYLAYCVANYSDTTYCGIPYIHGHYWSLSLEEQFYLLFPSLFFFFNRSVFIVLLLVLIIVQLFWARPIYSYGWFFRTDGLCWGVLLAFLSGRSFYSRLYPRTFDRAWFCYLFLPLFVVLLPYLPIAVARLGPKAQYYCLPLIAAFSAILVWLASYNRNLFAGRGLYRKCMLYFGSRSYALYVSHMIVFRMFKYGYDHSAFYAATSDERLLANFVAWSLGIALTAGSSEATYRFIESRYRDTGRLIAAKVVQNGFGPKWASKPGSL